MSIIFRYLIRQIMVSMLAVSGILLLVFMSGRFIKYLASAAEGELAAGVLFAIMGYRFPGFLELILPLGLFIGILLAYGRMYLESEMTVKQLHLTPPPVRLLPRNSAYRPITVEGDMVMEVFGVVTNVIRPLKRGGQG